LQIEVEARVDAGVTEVWVVDPEDRSVDLFRGDRKPIRLSNDQVLTSPDVLPGFECVVNEFFRHL